jgi:acyl-CoA synthetase (AMP-forming)/AMP-acid ligase II
VNHACVRGPSAAEGYWNQRAKSRLTFREEALIGHPAVLEAGVVGHPDVEGLIKPKAFVVLQQSAQREDPAALTARVAGSRQGADRGLEISALDRILRQPAEDRDREDPALQIARGRLIRFAKMARRTDQYSL